MNEVGMLIEVCIQQHTCRLHRVKSVLIEARIKDTCRLHVKTELKQMNEVGKYNVESIISAIIASSILKKPTHSRPAHFRRPWSCTPYS